MVLSVGKCPISCLVGGLVVLGCGGDALMLGGLGLGKTDAAAVSGNGAPAVSAGTVASGAAAPAPAAGAGTGYEGHAAGAGGNAGGAAGLASLQAAGMAGDEAGMAGMAGSAGSGRWRRRSGSAGAGAAAEGGGGGAGMRGTDPSTDASRAGSGGTAADGCVQNLACQLPAQPSTDDAHQDCVDRINQFREQCACLPPLERWVEGEACADEMAKYDSTSSEAHAAFGAGICNGGSAQNECPGWRSEEQIVGVCLQRMWDEGPPPMSDCAGSCFQMYGHFLNMTNQRMTKVACGFYEKEDGLVWSVQNFAR